MYHLHRIILFIILIKHWTLNTETQRHIFLIPTLGPQNCSFLLFHYIVFWFVNKHCVKSVRIRSFSDPYFPRFKLITGRYSISLRIQSESGKMRTRKTPNTDTFHAVKDLSSHFLPANSSAPCYRNVVHAQPFPLTEYIQLDRPIR